MSEWIETTLGAISTQRKGINYKSEDYCPDDTGHPFITIKCFQKGGGYEPTGIKFYDGRSTKADHLNHGDILFSVTDLTRAGDIVGSPLRVPQFGNLAPALASILPARRFCVSLSNSSRRKMFFPSRSPAALSSNSPSCRFT